MPSTTRARLAQAVFGAAALFLAVPATGLFLAAPAADATPATPAAKVGMTPVGTTASYFTETMTPGTSRQLAVKLSNNGSSSAVASTYAADVYSIVNGGFGARLSNQAPTGVTTWLTYPAITVTLGAGQAVDKTFTVSVPKTATPGEHVTSVVVQYQQPATTTGPVALSQVSREALPVIIDVPGPHTPVLAIGTASQAAVDGQTVISVGVTNSGNIRLDPVGRFVVRNDHGSQIVGVDVKMGTIYPGDSTSIQSTQTTILPAGEYSVTLALGDPAVGIDTKTDTFRLDITAPLPAQIPTKAIPAGNHTPPAADISVELILGLVIAALLAGVGGTFGITTWRRRKTKAGKL